MPPIRRSTYLLAAIALAGFVVSLAWHPTPAPAFVGLSSADIPATIGAWQSKGDHDVAPEVQDALASADLVARTYASPGTDLPDLDFILIGGTDRTALHDPRSCLVGAGWRLENDRSETLPGTDITARSCDAVGQPDSPGYDIVYLYVVDGQIRNQVTEIRGEMLVSALLGRKNRPVYFLRVLIPIDDNPAVRAANHRVLLKFAADTWKALAPKISAPHGTVSTANRRV